MNRLTTKDLEEVASAAQTERCLQRNSQVESSRPDSSSVAATETVHLLKSGRVFEQSSLGELSECTVAARPLQVVVDSNLKIEFEQQAPDCHEEEHSMSAGEPTFSQSSNKSPQLDPPDKQLENAQVPILEAYYDQNLSLSPLKP